MKDNGKITQPTPACYEKGRREPNLEMLGSLAEFYGVNVDWLLSVGSGKSYMKEQ